MKKAPVRLAIGFLVGISVLAGWGLSELSNLNTHYSLKQFLPEKHVLQDRTDATNAAYFLEELPPMLATIELGQSEQGSWLEKKRIDKLAKTTQWAAELKEASGAISIATVEGAFDSPEGLTVGALLEETPSKYWHNRVLADPILSPSLISKDGRTVLLVVNRGDISNEEMLAMAANLRNKIQQDFPKASVSVGGVPAIQSSLGQLLSSELANLSLFALLGMVIALLAVFKNFSSVVVAIYIMALANIASLCWMSLFGVPFTVLSSTLPILVSVTVVSMVTHTMLRFAKEWGIAKSENEDPNKWSVIIHTIKVLFLPNLLTSLTTCVGFAALMTTDVPLIQQYGETVSWGVMVSWLASMLVLPPLLLICKVPEARAWTQKQAEWATWVMHKRKPLLASLLVIFCVMAWSGRNQNWSARLFDDLPENHEARKSTETIDAAMGGMIPLNITVTAKDNDAWNEPQKLIKLDQLTEKWRQNKSVASALALPDFIRASKVSENIQLPADRRAVAEIYFLYSLSEGRPLDKFMTSEGKGTRIAVRLHDVPADQMQLLVGQITQETKAAFPDLEVVASGMATTVHSLNDQLSMSLLNGFWVALALIALLLVFVFRSIRWTIAAIIPNMVPPIALLYFLAILGTPIKPGIALVFSIALGLAFNNTVYLLGRLKSLYKKDRAPIELIEQALRLEGVPCFLSTISLLAGFTVFLASFFQINQLLGTYLLISIVAGLLGDLIFLPITLGVFSKILPAPATAGGISFNGFLRKGNAMSTSIVAFITTLLIFTPEHLAASKQKYSADAILKKVDKQMYSSNESAHVKMRIIEKNGSSKLRDLVVKRQNKKNHKKVLVRLQSPSDVRGTGLLSWEKDGQKDQWLYLPSSKKTRRLRSKSQGGNFLGSELSYEDMGGMIGTKFKNKLISVKTLKGQKVAIIESVPQKGKSSYSKIETWVSLKKYVVIKARYFDKKGKLLKVASFSKYKRFGRKIWRAQKLQIENKQSKRATVLALLNLKVNNKQDSDEFTVAALEDDQI